MSIKVECCECHKKETFADAKDITYNRWTIVAWNLPANEPLCVCKECDYGQPKKTK